MNIIVDNTALDVVTSHTITELEWEFPGLSDFLKTHLRYGLFFNHSTLPDSCVTEAIPVHYSHNLILKASQHALKGYPFFQEDITHELQGDILACYDTEDHQISIQNIIDITHLPEQDYHMVLMLPTLDEVMEHLPYGGNTLDRDNVMDYYEEFWHKLYEKYHSYTYQIGGHVSFLHSGSHNTFIMVYQSSYGDNGKFYLHHNKAPSLDLQMY